ncbi:MAG: hypothetical protein WAU81_12985 [Candidatus Aminicenantales bacterium]
MKNRYCLVATLLVILFLDMRCESTKTISDELIGVWRTQAISHRGTFFELRKDQISFGTDTGEVFNHVITKVKRKKDEHNAWILYTVYYLNDSSQTYQFPFYYQPSGQGTILFKNKPDEVWRRDKS